LNPSVLIVTHLLVYFLILSTIIAGNYRSTLITSHRRETSLTQRRKPDVLPSSLRLTWCCVPYPVESINNLRHNYLFADTDLSKAVQHAVTMGREGQCRVPKPRLIQVKDVYPHPSKTYIPHCTILHLCGDDAGCCKSDTLTCTARKAEQVELYFYVSCCEICLKSAVRPFLLLYITDPMTCCLSCFL